MDLLRSTSSRFVLFISVFISCLFSFIYGGGVATYVASAVLAFYVFFYSEILLLNPKESVSAGKVLWFLLYLFICVAFYGIFFSTEAPTIGYFGSTTIDFSPIILSVLATATTSLFFFVFKGRTERLIPFRKTQDDLPELGPLEDGFVNYDD